MKNEANRVYSISMFMLFLLSPLQNHAIMTSRCMYYIFFRGGKVEHSDDSVLPVMKKEGKGKGKWIVHASLHHDGMVL